jgi:protein-tyrosine-phosphatase
VAAQHGSPTGYNCCDAELAQAATLQLFKFPKTIVPMNAQVESSKTQTKNSAWKLWIAQSHGRKQGFALHLVNQALCFAGAYRRFQTVDWKRVRRLMFICKGNICRSPYCEARARSLGLKTLSRGLQALKGRSPDPVVAGAGKRRGVDLTPLYSTPFQWPDVRPGDLLIAMEPGQARWLQASQAEPAVQITLLGLWSRPQRPYIQDPLGMSEEYVETCLTILDSAINNIAGRLTSANGK